MQRNYEKLTQNVFTMKNVTKGKLGESIAIVRFLERGFEVYAAVADLYGTDLIVMPPNRRDKILRIQVKSVTSEKKGFRIRRNPYEVDYYFLVNIENNDFWIIPEKIIKTQIHSLNQNDKLTDLILPIQKEKWKEYLGFDEILRHTINRRFRFHASRTGKIGEKLAANHFLKNRYEVYEAIADEGGIDLVVKKNNEHLDVQVKYASKGYSFRNIADKARTNYYYLFIRGDKEEFFFLPSDEVAKHTSKSGTLALNENLRRFSL